MHIQYLNSSGQNLYLKNLSDKSHWHQQRELFLKVDFLYLRRWRDQSRHFQLAGWLNGVDNP